MNKLLLIVGAAALLPAAPALAGPGNGHGKAAHAKHMNALAGPMGHGAHGCPPGLAKKNNGCLPPGQAKKLYNVGQRLPYGYNSWVPYNQIPYDLRRQSSYDPYGRYAYDNGYYYQVDPTTMIVRQVLGAILR